MEWLILLLLVPAVLIPVVLLGGFAGCRQILGIEEPILGPPVNLEATPVIVSDRSLAVSLSWNTADPFGFPVQIERATDGGAYATIADHTTDNPFLDMDVFEGNDYIYQVRAISGEERSEPSNPAPVSLKYKTAFVAELPTDGPNRAGFCHVQIVRSALLTASGKIARITVLGSTAGNLTINRIYISQAALPSSANPNPNPYDSADEVSPGGITKVLDKDKGDQAVSLSPPDMTQPDKNRKTLDPIYYNFDQTKDLIIAFDISFTEGNVRRGGLTGAEAYFKANTQEAGLADRSPGYPGHELNTLYLVEKIEVLGSLANGEVIT